MPNDFVRSDPTPGTPTVPSALPAVPPPRAILSDGLHAYWSYLHAHSTYSDGAGPPFHALAMARATGLHYYTVTDHGWWVLWENQKVRRLLLSGRLAPVRASHSIIPKLKES